MSHIDQWLNAAIKQAEKSWAEGGIPIGAVLVDAKNQIVAQGHNERVQNSDPTAHAEIVCLRNAGRRKDWNLLSLVSTLSPCIMCSGAILLFGIKNVFVGENKTFLGAENLMRSKGVEIEVLNNERCVTLMRRMQNERPELWNEDIGCP
tara:strand:+ start:751 stop:1197 length:447 start_codon:yes stop_codon:yes gene_type:complete